MFGIGSAPAFERAPARVSRGFAASLAFVAAVDVVAAIGIVAVVCAVGTLAGCRERGDRGMPPPELFAAEPSAVRSGNTADAPPQPGSAGVAASATEAPGAVAAVAAAAVTAAASADAGGSAPAPPPPATPVSDDPNCPGPGEDVTRCPRLAPTPAASATIGQILIGWVGSLPDPRVVRDAAAAELRARELLHLARLPDADIFALAAAHSDD